MPVHQNHHLLRFAALALLMAAAPSCGSEQPYDWKNRDLEWRYGPTTGGARSEHLIGTGTQGDGAIAEGWKCLLSEGKRLTVRPYQLASSHALFGKATMIVGLFAENGKQLDTVRSEAITAQNATFTFEIDEALAKQLYDVVIWFGGV